MKDILIAGGSGLIGSRLTELLLNEGYHVSILSRSAKRSSKPGLEYIKWDPERGQFPGEVLFKTDAVINLAGANTGAKRWTPSYKQEMLDSRVLSTRLIVEKLNATPGHKVQVLINASAMGYYGLNRPGIMTEEDGPGSDFLAKLTVRWEDEALKLQHPGTRLLIYRQGVILSSKGGAMRELMKPIRFFVGAPLGSGKQFMPWIHIDDLCRMYIMGLRTPGMQGIYNTISPEDVTNRTLTKALAHAMHRPLFLPPVPGFVLKIMVGEMAETVLGSYKLSADKIIHAGFQFQFPELHAAIKDLIRRKI